MNTRVAKVCGLLWVGTICSLSPTPALANNDYGSSDPFAVIADAVLVRPASLVATAIGSAFFVVSLPVAAASKSVKKTANILVVKPAKATFKRPLGEFENMDN